MSAREGFQTSVVPTRGKGTVLVHRQVPDLSCRTGVASINLLIDDQACANAASHLDECQILFTASGAICPFSERPQFRIVIQGHGGTPFLLQGGANREAIPARHNGRRHDHAFIGNDGTRHTDPNPR